MTMYQQRRENLRRIIEQWGGPTSLAKKLKHANGSFLAQLAGPNPTREVTERSARKIEKQLDLPQGWLDQHHNEVGITPAAGTNTAPPKRRAGDTAGPLPVDVDHLALCVSAVTAVCEQEGSTPAPEKFADLVSLIYASGLSNDRLFEYARRLVHLTN